MEGVEQSAAIIGPGIAGVVAAHHLVEIGLVRLQSAQRQGMRGDQRGIELRAIDRQGQRFAELHQPVSRFIRVPENGGGGIIHVAAHARDDRRRERHLVVAQLHHERIIISKLCRVHRRVKQISFLVRIAVQIIKFIRAVAEGDDFVMRVMQRAAGGVRGDDARAEQFRIRVARQREVDALLSAKVAAVSISGVPAPVQMRDDEGDRANIDGQILVATLAKLNPTGLVQWAPDEAWRLADNCSLPLPTADAMIAFGDVATACSVAARTTS